jgi:16S rRNA (adenine1518-N6/adenine1519-N6)-dimethyltransferase
MTLTEIRAALDSRGLRPLKQLGQNFLHDQNLAKWLAEHAAAGLPAGATVAEIGPGLGALTSVLLGKDLHLIALEKDRGLCVFLRERFAPEIAAGRLDLREGDALELLPRIETAPTVICGNLPYYISTPLLMESLRLPGVPARLFFLVQKEVG